MDRRAVIGGLKAVAWVVGGVGAIFGIGALTDWVAATYGPVPILVVIGAVIFGLAFFLGYSETKSRNRYKNDHRTY